MIVSVTKKLVIIGVALFFSQNLALANDIVKPFILVSQGAGELNVKTSDIKQKLTAAGFDIVGEYSPYADVNIIVVSNDSLKNSATKSERGGYGAIMRVSITKVNESIEVAYTNPAYWSNAYRMSTNLEQVGAALSTTLGAGKAFGTGEKNLSKKDMRKYHYTFMMEYFDDPSELAKYSKHADAVAAIEKNLAAGAGGGEKVYRVDLGKDNKGQQMTLFGVALKGINADDCSGDKYIMNRIDRSQPRHSAHLPYELLVYGSTTEALYARFRIAISWPHLPMMASETGATFMSIMCAPGAIEDALKLVAGAKTESDEDDF